VPAGFEPLPDADIAHDHVVVRRHAFE
jgi:hypothetical protein